MDIPVDWDVKHQPNKNITKTILAGNAACGVNIFDIKGYYTIIDFNEVDIRIYLPEKVIIHRGP